MTLRTLHVLITSGGSREPIDDVRYVSNVSTGRLGAAVAAAFLAADHRVTLVVGQGTIQPSPHPHLVIVEYGSAADLVERMKALLTAADRPDGVIHAAAVADYAPIATVGKIKSDAGELVLRMVATPKVADQIRGWHPNVHLILFKLESGIPSEELLLRAKRTMERVGANGIVANLLQEVGVEKHRATLVRADGTEAPFSSREALATGLVEELESVACRGES